MKRSPVILIVVAVLLGIILLFQATARHTMAQAPDTTSKTMPSGQSALHDTNNSISGATSFLENFESGLVPSPGWSNIQYNPRDTWVIASGNPFEGTHYAHVIADDMDEKQSEWLISPEITANSGVLRFWSFGSLYWCRDTMDNCHLNVWVLRNGWGGGDDTLLGRADDDWLITWRWAETTIDLESYLDGTPVQVGFQYVGIDGAEVGLDLIRFGPYSFFLPVVAK
jgi:hypothetical protein